jgi:hypothetical protein
MQARGCFVFDETAMPAPPSVERKRFLLDLEATAGAGAGADRSAGAGADRGAGGPDSAAV